LKLPPRLVRRLVLDPLVFVLCVILLALSPVFLLVAFVLDLGSHGRWPTVRLITLGVVFSYREVCGIAMLLLLWIASGFGIALSTRPFQKAHYAVLRWWLTGLFSAARLLLGLKVEIEERQPPRAGPVLVFSRHAGAGDSILIAQTLMVGFKRHCRVVMKAELQFDPVIDIAGNRCPNAFVRPNSTQGDKFAASIGKLAKGLRDNEALMLFPEGGNFTFSRWTKAIASLRKRGLEGHATAAEKMQHLLPPRPGGASAAITAAADADVVFVAHTGLEDLDSLGAIRARIPLKEPIRGRYWRVGPADIPPDGQERIDWLFEWWARIDKWIHERRPAERVH